MPKNDIEENKFEFTSFNIIEELYDTKMQIVYESLVKFKNSSSSYSMDQKCIKILKNYFLLNNKLLKKYNKAKMAPQVSEKNEIIKQSHDGNSHFGIDSTVEFIKNNYYFI